MLKLTITKNYYLIKNNRLNKKENLAKDLINKFVNLMIKF